MITLSSGHVLFLMTSLIYGLSQLLQALEYQKNSAYLDQAWPWGRKYFSTLITAQILLSLIVLFFHHWFFYLCLFGIHLFMAKKWRGTFNGGSDMMSFTLIVGLLIASLPFAEKSQFFKHLGLLIIGIQSFLSYLIAGLIKLKNASWRNGAALKAFLKCTRFHQVDPRILANSKLLSWAVILFETSVLFLIFNTTSLFFFIGAALIFHVMNAWYFGLNRFLWTWAASWPGLIYLSQVIVKTLGIS